VTGAVAWLAAVATAGTPPDVQRSVADLFKEAGVMAAALVGVGTVLWWLFGPRVRDFVEKIVETHAQLQPNGGHSTHDLARRAASAGEQALRMARQAAGAAGDAAHVAETLTRRAESNARALDSLRGVVEETRDSLTEHVQTSDRRLDRYLDELRRHGIDLPGPDD
jgi:methyl-accepting chemotaxis protein